MGDRWPASARPSAAFIDDLLGIGPFLPMSQTPNTEVAPGIPITGELVDAVSRKCGAAGQIKAPEHIGNAGDLA